MIIMPAVILGGLVVICVIFYLGYLLTYTILRKIAKSRRGFSTLYQNILKEKQQLGDRTEKELEKISAIGGVVTLGIAALLIFSIRNEWTVVIWILLTGIGFLFAFLSPVIFGSIGNPVAKTKPEPGATTRVPPNSPDQQSNTTNAYQGSASKIRQAIKIIIVCENCSQKIRIPRQNNKLIVTCPTCRHEFKYQYYGLGFSSNNIKIFYRRISRWVSRFFSSRDH